MGLMNGKTIVIFGVANKRSIAWGIAQVLSEHGAKLALNYQNERMEESVRKLAEELPQAPFMAPCDVTDQAQIDTFFAALKRECGAIDGLVHCVAFAKREELGGSFSETSWDGYSLAQHVSAYSLVATARAAVPLMEGRPGAIVSLSYYGSEKVVPGYNVMGVAKAALESSTRYLAHDLGPKNVRVNCISAGPIKTVSAMGVSNFSSLLDSMADKAPLRRTISQTEVGNAACFLLSDMASGITGQVLYVDAGYSVMGA
ncbi:MAG: enoyl-ACP reductase [Planctomycetota bacterium]